ncbi:YqjF family protein [Natrinema caseinilyticum]|uniref:YqjF family protein n=1 Tax=Natrinema caseinilyticum TaxID=2961570 RepID=UPI0020C38788|nr:DUF2071 domain-containing protein [Natrinema caseinilyticum]
MNEQRTDLLRRAVAGGSSSNVTHVASMTWRDGLFIHWPVDPDQLRPHIPGQLTLETRDGRAWVSALPFVLTNVGLRGTPSITRLAFAGIGVRTSVRRRGERGVYFFSIDIGNSWIASTVGRAVRLPVSRARVRVGATEDNHVAFSCERLRRDADVPARFAASYRPDGETFTARPDTLAYWLTAHRRFYGSTESAILTGEIAHDPWLLQPAAATIHENTMLETNGLPAPTGEPVVHYADELSMTASVPRRMRT